MQLVPKSHHQAPGAVQNTLHPLPNGGGGLKQWGGGRPSSLPVWHVDGMKLMGLD